ncbi:DUF4020 domain-containing protein [Vibrio sp. FNV 38]|nr:DUF4020 domain-containing protein [Vibrio sp. FNV 38]
MILNGVNFPPKLVEAAEQGKLVVFAGAGVSMGEPSNLPSFWKLAEDIARDFGREPKNPLDQFLGSLSPDELVIKNATVKTLQSIESQPKELHSHLLNMFASSESVRVVTTNFDPLFTEASNNIWPNTPKIYTAPALPLGYDFEGIVHIHGANTYPKSIVITDRGFGQAYLTDGWASRFLIQMFETYTILFTGYSHDDMVMSYLARALPDKAKGKRFALVGSKTINQESKWQSLGIEPVYFPQEQEHNYDTLSSSTKALSAFLRRRPSDWQEHIGRIAGQDGPLDLEDEHAIHHALKDVAKVRYFISKAKSEKWALWLHEQRAFESLFDNGSMDEVTGLLKRWLLSTFFIEKHEVLFELIAKEHNRISHHFWFDLVRSVSQSEFVAQQAHWIDLLLHLCPKLPDVYGLQVLAEAAEKAGMKHHALRVFFKMAEGQMRLNLQKNYIDLESLPEWRAEVKISSPEWNLNEVWQKVLSPHLPIFFKSVLQRAEFLLTDKVESAGVWMAKESANNIDSWLRSAIEPHEQDSAPEAFDVVIDAMRDAIEVAIKQEPSWVVRWCNDQLASEITLLRRIAIHGIRLNQSLNATTKLCLILEHDIHDAGIRHEIFELLRALYPYLASPERQRLLSAVLSYQGWKPDMEPENLASEHWQWLYLLRRADESCSLLICKMDKLKTKFPELREREYPDLHTWSGEANILTSRWSSAELLAKDSKVWFEEIEQFEPERSSDYDRASLSWAVGEAGTEQPTWALKFCDYLSKTQNWQSDLWFGLLGAFEPWPEDDAVAERVMALLTLPSVYQQHPRSVVKALKGHLKNVGSKSVSDINSRANQIVETIWLKYQLSEQPISSGVDWVNLAINTLEGDIAKYWISALDFAVKSDNQELINQCLHQMKKLANTSNPKTVFTVPLLSQQLNFLYYVDAQWVVDELLPMFSLGSERVQQAWDGFLYTGGVSATVFGSLKSYFEEMRDYFEANLQNKAERFIEHYVAAAFFQIAQPEQGWLPKLITSTSPKRRVHLAKQLCSFLARQEPSARQQTWDGWFQQYWQNRINACPIPLDAEEAAVMLSILDDALESFDAAVELTIQMPPPNLEHSHLIYALRKKEWIADHSNAIAKLVVYLLREHQTGSALYGLKDLVAKIRTDEVESDLLNHLRQALIKAGLSI